MAVDRRTALDELREGAAAEQFEYWSDIVGFSRPDYPPHRHADELARSGQAIIGTPEDRVAALRALRGRLGPFGGVLIDAREWAPRAATLRSHPLFAERVGPAIPDVLDVLG